MCVKVFLESAALVGSTVERREGFAFQTLGERPGWRDQTEALDGYVPLHPILTAHLRAWREQSPHAKGGDFVFNFLKSVRPCSPLHVYFRRRSSATAAKKAGVAIGDGQRFGLHNLRHSLSNWLVNKAKAEPNTVQGFQRHAKVQTTLDLYTQEDCDETLAAQGEYLTALGVGTQMVR